MKKYLSYLAFLVLSFWNIQNVNAQCSPGVSYGSLTFTNSWQTVTGNAGDRAYWSINAVNGVKYSFSACSGAESDSYIRIYDNTWNQVAFNDDNGPYCGGTKASIDWTAPADGTYYIFFTKYSCDNLSVNTDLQYMDDGLHSELMVTDIVSPAIASCSAGVDSVIVDLTNNSAITLTSFDVDLDITNPDGTTSNYSKTFSGTLASTASTSLIFNAIDFTQNGDFSIVATPQTSEVGTISRTEVYSSALSTPVIESFSIDPVNWNMGAGFFWSSGNESIDQTLTSADDTLFSEPYLVDKTDTYFAYNLYPYSLTSGDTVFIQLKEKCTGAITNIDTVTNLSIGDYNYYSNSYQQAYNLNAFMNKAVETQFVFRSQSGNSTLFRLYEIKFKAGNDIKLEDILVSNFSSCGSNAYPLKVVLRNEGPKTQSSLSVDLRLYGQKDSTITRTSSSAIQYGQTDTLDFGTIDTREVGLYEFVATATIPVDDELTNNSKRENYSIAQPEGTPVSIVNDFSNYDWYNDRFNVFSNYMESYTTFTNDNASVTSNRIESIPENTYLAFEYKVLSWDGGGNSVDSLGANDIIKVYIADDFNGTYTEVYYIDEARDVYNSGNYILIPSIDLSAYQGKDINVKVEIQNGATADETNSVRLDIDNFYIGAADMNVSDIIYSYDAACGTPAMTVRLDVTNSSSVDAVNVPVYFEFTPSNGTEVKDSIIVSSVSANSTVRVSLSNTYDAGTPDDYRLSAYTKYTNDTNTSNDLRNESFTISPILTLPFLEPFDASPFSGKWNENSMNWTGSEVYSDNLNYGNTAYMESNSKIGPITAGTQLSFKFKVVNGVGQGYLYDGDTVKVLISSDCGTNWNSIYTITHSNMLNLGNWEYVSNLDLSAYNGSDIRIMFEVLKNDPDGSVSVRFDDIEIQASGDAKVVGVQFPQYKNNVAICGAVSESAMVIVQNNGVNTIDTIPVELGVMFGTTNTDTLKLSAEVYNLAAGDKDTIYISGFNSEQAGNYYVYGKTTLTDDLDDTNDKYGNVTLITQDLHSLPWTDFDGSVLPTDWQYYNHNNSSGISIYNDILNDGDSAYFVPQKFGTIQSDYYFRLSFKSWNYDEAGNLLNYNIRMGDSILVQISDDCGATFTNLGVLTNFTAENSNFVDTAWNLDAYIGKEIAARILTIKGSGIGTLQTGFNNFKVTIPQPDIQLNTVYVNDNKENDVCGNAVEPIYAVFSNVSTYDNLSNFDINAYIKDANNNALDTLSISYTGTLLPGDKDTVMLGSFNSEMPENYTIETEIVLSGDVNEANNTNSMNYKIWDMFDAKTYSQNFSNNSDGWKLEQNALRNWSGSSWTMQAGSLAAEDSSIFYSPKLEAIALGYTLQFDYMISGDFLVGDKIEVYASDNCGASFNLLGTISNPSNLAGFASTNVSEEMSLAAYIGKDVYFKFVVSNVNGNSFTAYFDNVKIIRTDIAVIGIVNNLADFEYTDNLASYNPNSSSQGIVRYETCGNLTEDVYAIVENNGDTKISSFSLDLSVTGKYQTSFTVNSTQALESGMRALIKIGTVNTETNGLVDMKLAATTANDGDASNDTIGFSVTTQKVYETPFSAFNSGNFNENYYWKYDYDTLVSSSHMNLSGSTLYSDNLSEGQEAYAISPKLNIPTNGGVEFSYYVQNSIEGHIIHDEAIEVQISTNCSPSWTTLMRVDVTTNDTSKNDVQFVDLSAFAGQQARIKFIATKGYSNGTFYAQFSGINVAEYPKANAVLMSGDELFSGNSFMFCQDTSMTLSLTEDYNSVAWYRIDLADAQATPSYLSSSPEYSFNVSNKSYMYYAAMSNYSYSLYSDTITINTMLKPGKPIVPMGADAVVSDVEALYVINPVANTTSYSWNLSSGGDIVGNDTSAVVYWTHQFRGTADISVRAQNACGLGISSEPLTVRVEYLGTGINQVENVSWSVFPNPSHGNFTIEFGNSDLMGSTLNVYNVSGQKVMAKKIDAVNMNINLNNYSSGLYKVVVIKDNILYKTNIVVQ